MLSAVYAVVVYLSVCVCVCHTPVLSQNGRFDKILAYDRRTDRQTLTHTHTHTHTYIHRHRHDDSIYRASIASRGKNRPN